MKVIDLLQKINDEKLDDLPTVIRYRGKLYTRHDAYFTYYEKGKSIADTLCIDTYDIDKDLIEVIDDDDDDDDDNEDLSKLCDKIYNLCEKIEEITDKIEMLDL